MIRSLWARRGPEAAETSRRVIVGLGNPGAEYHGTRHNVGYAVVDRLLDRWSPLASRNKFDADVFELRRDGGVPLLLVKPRTYMNLSGKTVGAVVRFYGLPLDQLMVVCDDFHLPLGRLRFRREGSHGGQKGLADIIQRLGTNAFPRLRIGIAAPGEAAIEHVLGKFRPEERDVVNDAIDRACDALGSWLQHGLEETMNRFNASP